MKKLILLILFFNTSILLSNIGTYGFKDFKNYYFVETGCFNGGGIFKALETNGFSEIYSFDINLDFVNDCKNKFRQYSNIKIIHGNSKDNLWNLIKKFDKKITFWLDAHIYPPIKGIQNCPLMDELEQIKKHPIKNHTILIDDMACAGTLAFDYITIEDLINKIKEINNKYTIKFLDGGENNEAKNNVLVAFVN